MKTNDIKTIAILGAGTMGHSIAQIFAQFGYQVQLWSRTQKTLDRASNLIKTSLTSLAESGQFNRSTIEETFSRIQFSADLEIAANGADFVLESVAESPEVKNNLFSTLNKICSQQTIFSSNTSGLNIFEILDFDVDRPERIIITHWFSPPALIPLVEVIPGPVTSSDVVDSTLGLLEAIGKKTVTMKKFVPAFIVNRIQDAINKTVMEMIDNDWASPEDIDIAIKNTLGIRLPVVGVAQSLDFAGLDLINNIMQRMGVKSDYLVQRVEKGEFGTKSSKGIYDYQGRSEAEILQKRDERYLKIRAYLEELGSFDPV